MTFLHAIILGIVEGITEFLPVSSTGHLILASRLLGLSQDDFLKTFEIAIQLGAIFAVVVLYWKKIWGSRELIKKITVTFIPTGILGLIFYKIIKTFLLGNETVVLFSLAIVGLLLIIAEIFFAKRKRKEAGSSLEKISYKQSFIIGLVQSFSMVPGVSRSGATILGGLALGIDRKAIVEFSFLLAIPTMLAATGYDLLKNFHSLSGTQADLLAIGFLVSFLVAIPAVKFLISFVQKNNFILFGIYRIIVAVLFAVFVLR